MQLERHITVLALHRGHVSQYGGFQVADELPHERVLVRKHAHVLLDLLKAPLKYLIQNDYVKQLLLLQL